MPSILDHSGAVFRHGCAEDRVEWTLDPDKRATIADAYGSGSSARTTAC